MRTANPSTIQAHLDLETQLKLGQLRDRLPRG